MRYEVNESSGNLMMEKSFSFALRGRVSEPIPEESRGAQSSPDFQAKISIAYKEARETSYRLRLLLASKYLTERQFSSLHADCEELIRILGSAQLTMRTKIQKGL